MMTMTKRDDALRQMIAVLTAERQALAALDIDALMGCTSSKAMLCLDLDDGDGRAMGEESRALIESAQRMNAVNRQIRNLVAANLAARLDAIMGSNPLYCVGRNRAVTHYSQGERAH